MEADEPFDSDGARDRVIAFLAFLTSDACLQAGARRLPPERLAFELCRLWFDEVYLPGTRYLDGLKGDYSEEAARQFLACFTSTEQAALERFHRFFELRMDMVPAALKQAGRIPQQDAWTNLRKSAANVLYELVDDPEALQRRLAKAVEDRLSRPGEIGRPAAPGWIDRLTG